MMAVKEQIPEEHSSYLKNKFQNKVQNVFYITTSQQIKDKPNIIDLPYPVGSEMKMPFPTQKQQLLLFAWVLEQSLFHSLLAVLPFIVISEQVAIVMVTLQLITSRPIEKTYR